MIDSQDDLGPLPQADTNSVLQSISFAALRDALPAHLFVLRHEPGPDAGVDCCVELVVETFYSNMRSQIQVKATKDAKYNPDGSISFAADVSNINYLLAELNSLYVLYVDQTKELRYLWVMDEIMRIEQKTPMWKHQKTVTLRFQHKLDEISHQNIHDRIYVKSKNNRKLQESIYRAGATLDDVIALVASGPRPPTITVHYPEAHADIDSSRDLINDGLFEHAIKSLKNLKAKYWHQYNEREKYRIDIYMGHAHEYLGEIVNAADCYFDAIAHQPSDDEARSLEANGHFLLGNGAKAIELCDRILADSPLSVPGITMKLRAMPDETTYEELIKLIPEDLANSVDILRQVIERGLRLRCFRQAEEKARTAMAQEPDEVGHKRMVAVAVLHDVSSMRNAAAGRNPTELEIRRLHEAEQLLTHCLKFAKRESDIFEIRYNRAEVRLQIGDLNGAETDFRLVSESDSCHPGHVIRHASVLRRQGRLDDTIILLKPYVSAGLNPQLCVLMGQLLGSRNKYGDVDEAIKILRLGMPHARQANIQIRTDMVYMLMLNLSLAKKSVEILDLADNMQEGFVSDAVVMALRIEGTGRSKSMNEASVLANQMLEKLGETPTDAERSIVADVISRLGNFAKALEVIKPTIPMGVHSPEAIGVLEWAANCNDHNYIRELCESFRDSGVWNQQCIGFEAIALIQLRRVEEASKIAQIFISRIENPIEAGNARDFFVEIGVPL